MSCFTGQFADILFGTPPELEVWTLNIYVDRFVSIYLIYYKSFRGAAQSCANTHVKSYFQWRYVASTKSVAICVPPLQRVANVRFFVSSDDREV